MTKQSPGQKLIHLPVRLPSQILLHPPSESYFTFYQVRVHSLPRSVDSHVCYLMAMTYLEMPGSALPPPFGFPIPYTCIPGRAAFCASPITISTWVSSG